jgi:uncharacterized coiled-coil protein SlyX
MLKGPKKLINKLRRRLAWLLVGYALEYRLKNLESTMDLAQAKMEEIEKALAENDGKVNTKETVEERKALKADRETWSGLYFRYHDLHVEVSGFMEYLRS